MRTITLDARLLDKFGDLSKAIDLCDESGHLVATSEQVFAMLRRLEAELS